MEDFLRVFKRGQYAHTKLANVLFTYEAQRRYAALGIENCAVDPGEWPRGGVGRWRWVG